MEILIILLVVFVTYVVLGTYVFSSFQDRCFRNLWSGERTGVFQEEQKTYDKLFLHYGITFDDPFLEDETMLEKVSKLTSDAYSFDMKTGTRNGISVSSMLANEISRRRRIVAPIDKPVETLIEEPTFLWRENLEIASGIWVSPEPNSISSVLAHFKNHGLIDLDIFQRKRAYKVFSDADEPFTEAASKFRKMISDPFGRPFFSLCDLLRIGHAGVKDENGVFHRSDEARIKWFRMGAEAGNHLSRHWLINVLSDAESNSMDMDEAIKWLEVGVAENDLLSVTKLSEIYAAGIGVARNPKKSKQLIELAKKLEKN